ncbi:MAG: hypothetical protein L0J68_08335 [Micrococcaceae bacterium]|nr:hypothetical protein [Micrococcaceae bacterium]MDN5823211.1 hypothetical protein [Micrococcaceae bacterium]MDN5878992.1 hypothetical protein [Micrococcaceae bacterium]MDN5904820.1 hypothetical protein [Micrococcaceae bacterium]MDN6300277.1 hypothetical protein [Micrococcaceae bacterium]
MMEILFSAVVVIGAGLTLTRLPRLTHSRNQAIFLSGTAACLAFALMIPAVYEPLDGLFLRTNFMDIFAKLALLLAVNILVTEIARTLRNTRVQRLAAGLSGKTILVLTFALELVLFAFTDTPQPSPGLGLYIGDPLVLAYNTVIVVYIAYLGALLIGPLLRDARTPPQSYRQASSALLAFGFVLAIVRAVIMLATFAFPGLYEPGQIISGFSALFVIAGLGSAWIALRKYGTPRIKQSTLRIE